MDVIFPLGGASRCYISTSKEGAPASPSPPPLSGVTLDRPTLTAYQTRVADAVRYNIDALCARRGHDHIGFATLTFADPAPDIQEAQARFARFKRGFLRDWTQGDWLAVAERSPRKRRLHFHLVVACPSEIRSGFHWHAYDRHDWRRTTSNRRLLGYFAEWREACDRYAFGAPHGPHPIRKDPGAIAWYVAGYIAKAVLAREVSDCHHKLVLVGKSARRSTVKTSPGAQERARAWRAQLGLWSAVLFGPGADLDTWREHFGRYWGLGLRDCIANVDPLSGECEHAIALTADTGTSITHDSKAPLRGARPYALKRHTVHKRKTTPPPP